MATPPRTPAQPANSPAAQVHVRGNKKMRPNPAPMNQGGGGGTTDARTAGRASHHPVPRSALDRTSGRNTLERRAGGPRMGRRPYTGSSPPRGTYECTADRPSPFSKSTWACASANSHSLPRPAHASIVPSCRESSSAIHATADASGEGFSASRTRLPAPAAPCAGATS